ncbi:MAG: class I SAM-dependent methyltransferase, partial [Candidatus Thermoplasmatota archaeon]|nr:class I SAM-dependent methyltransferase [Candidatus Thermoplasmatota archaeon]
WTTHMRDKSIELINNLQLDNVENALDLSCGTGCITNMLSTHTKEKAVGIDQSNGMLSVAKNKYKDTCKFYQTDVVEYLKKQPSNQFDIITNGWGLGYSKPYQIIKNAYRVLKPKGQFAAIDNTLLSIKEAIWTVIVTAAEDPTIFQSMFNIRFLPTLGALKRRMILSGFHIAKSWNGSKTYYVKDGKEAQKRLHNTGAFAGLENCVYPHRKKEFDKRFIANLERMYLNKKGIPITHRYIAAIGTKKN